MNCFKHLAALPLSIIKKILKSSFFSEISQRFNHNKNHHKKTIAFKIRRRWARGLNFYLGITNVYASN